MVMIETESTWPCPAAVLNSASSETVHPLSATSCYGVSIKMWLMTGLCKDVMDTSWTRRGGLDAHAQSKLLLPSFCCWVISRTFSSSCHRFLKKYHVDLLLNSCHLVQSYSSTPNIEIRFKFWYFESELNVNIFVFVILHLMNLLFFPHWIGLKCVPNIQETLMII